MTSRSEKTGVRMVRVSRDRDKQRLDNFLMAQLPGLPRSAVYKIVRTGQVRVNGKRAKPFQKLKSGDEIRIPPVKVEHREKARVPYPVVEQIEAAVLHEDKDLLVINKPAGIAVHGGSGLQWGLIEALRQSRNDPGLDLVHRLDRDTSGVLLVARNGTALRDLQAKFSRRETRKQYLALLDGRLPGDLWTVNEPLLKQEISGERFTIVDPDGKPSETIFRRIEHYGEATFVEATPITGRTHQIRAHAVFLDAPIAGDARYLDDVSLSFWQRRGLDRLFLHAHALEFEDRNGEAQHFSCPLPDDLNEFLNSQ